MATNYTTLTPTNEGIIVGAGNTVWSAARNATTGTAYNYGTSTPQPNAVVIDYTIGRGGGFWNITRSFLRFDTSAIDGDVTAATLKVAGVTNGGADIIVVKSDAFNGHNSLVGSDFNNLDFGTPYSSEDPTWNLNAYNSIGLNTAAKDDIKNLGVFRVAIIEHDHDYNDTSTTTDYRSGIWFQDGTYPIQLEVTYVTPFPLDLNGLSGSEIESINGIDGGNIASINGYSF